MKKYVFITGISTGLGKDLAIQLSSSGYAVIGTVRKPEDADLIHNISNGAITTLFMDASVKGSIHAALEKLKEIIGLNGLYALINNAGIAIPGPLELLSDEEIRLQMEVNFFSVHQITNSCIPLLKKCDISYIINISSVSGIFNNPFMGAYCISKHALESMNEIYRRELKPFGIKVVSIRPGPLKTEIWKKNLGVLQKFIPSAYEQILVHADKMIQNTEKKALPTSKVTKLVSHILKNQNPKCSYIIHKKPLLMKIIAFCTPVKIQDKLIKATLSKKNKIRPF